MLSSRTFIVAAFAWAGLGAAQQNASLDPFVTQEKSIALQGALNNIGPNGSKVPGASAGIVVASPSTVNPDYYYSWSRDSALTLKMIIDEFIFGTEGLQEYIQDYYHAQAVLQTITNPSGSLLPNGEGLGEPKFMVDGTRFNGAWGRPQRDGPALRAIALMTYCNWLIENGQTANATNVIWPIIANDLSYVGQYWNSTGFDLWEEISGSSFFTLQNQYRSLVQGAELASTLGVECTGCDQAPQVACFLQAFWNGEYFLANINVDDARSGKDANTILGPIAIFDVNATCDSPSLQPCHSRSLANFKVFIDSFRGSAVTPINAGIPANQGIAVGRYPEDVYYGGNPWYLITSCAAEFLYDIVAQWTSQGFITVDSTSLAFFQDLYPSAEETTYQANNGSDFANILNAITAYADSFIAIVQKYTPSDGSLSEQFNKTLPSNPVSANDLTWSYAAFVSMAERRAGQYPPSWVPQSETPPPATCAASSTPGAYAPATAAGAPNVTDSCTVPVTFVVNATTYYGENLYVVGNSTELGVWDVSNSQPMTAANYTSDRPEWFVEVEMAAGETVSYVYVRDENCDQGYIYETVNQTLVVPACGAAGSETNDAWVGPVGTSGNC